jgi:hypothetical protein
MDYKNNNPIQDESQDVLGRSERAKDLAKYIRTKFEEFEEPKKGHKDQPLTSHNIAVIGTWGEGKSSFINLLKEQLEEPKSENWFHKCLNKTRKFFKTDKGIEIKEFDPWYFPNKCDIHEQFLSLVDNRKNYLIWWLGYYIVLVVLLSSFRFDYYFEQWHSNETVQLILNFINKAIETLRATYLVPIAIVVYYSIRHPHNIKSSISKIKSIFALSSAFDFINLFEEDKFDSVKTKKQLKKLTDGRKLLVIIDNIDRLYPVQIKRVFDLVKGIGDLPNIIYILAFDNKVVSKALNKDDPEEGSKYLDKFIQYPVDLYTSYKELVIKEITEAFPNQETSGYYASELSQYITNLRDLKRLINTFKEKHTKLQEDVDFGQLLYITAISLQNNAIYRWLANSKDILCSKDQDKNAHDKLKKLKVEIDNLKPPSILWKIIEHLFPIIISENGGGSSGDNGKNNYINNYDYFDIYFKISFPDDLVSDSDFKSLVAVASNKDELTKSALTLLRPIIKEEKQKIPNRIANPFKWLNNLTTRLLSLEGSDRVCKNIPNWLLSLAKVTESYADEVENRQNQRNPFLHFHDFLDKLAQFLEKEDPAKDNDSPPIYAFLRIYLKETDPQRTGNQISADRIPKLKDVVIKNIEKYHNNDILQLSYFTTIIRFASSSPQEHESIVTIIKESIKLDDDDAFLKLMQHSIQTKNGKYVAIQSLEYYISFKEAAQRLEKIKQSGSGKSHDIDLYINSLSEYIINTEK